MSVDTYADNTVTTRIPPQLIRSDTRGKGAAEIGWGSPGDFKRCQAFARRHGIPGHMIDGFCANLHKIATGEWPGRNAHKAAMDYMIAAGAPDTANMIRWEGPLARIESPTGDRRQFPRDTLTYQSFPQPYRFQRQGFQGHQGAITVGVIESATERDVDEAQAKDYRIEPGRYVWGSGYFLDPNIVPEVKEAVHQIEHGVGGPSVDLDSFTAVLSKTLAGETVANMKRGRMRAATHVSVPAFADLRLKVMHPKELTASSSVEFAVNNKGWQNAPIAPREALFDADDAAKRIEAWANGDPAKMASVFLWIADSPNAPLIGRRGYRLPWGDIIDGKPYLIFHAVYAAAALLQGAHGGLPAIPEDQKGQLRSVITSIYEKMASEFGDDSIVAPWDRVEQQQAAGTPWSDDTVDEYESYVSSFDAALEEFRRTHRYTERKHPRVPGKPGGRANRARNPRGGEWVDTPHGPHGQIKVGGKWVYPPKRGEKGYRNPEKAVKGIAERGGGKGPTKRGGTRVVKKARTPEKHAPAPARKAAAPEVDSPNARRHLKSMTPMSRLERQEYLKKLKEHEVDNLVKYLGGTRHEDDDRGDLEIEILHQMEKDKSKESTRVERDKDVQRAKEAREISHGQGRKTVIAKKQKEQAPPPKKEAPRKVAPKKETPAKEAPKKEAPPAKEPPKKATKTTVAKKETGAAREHKLTPAQQSALERLREDENAKVHPATRKVLEREGYLDSDGKMTQKSRDHLGVKEAPKKEAPKKVVAKKAPAKEAPKKEAPPAKEAKTTVAKKAPPQKKTTEEHVKALADMQTRDEADKYLAEVKGQDLTDLAKHYNVNRGTVAEKRAAIREHTVGARLNSKAIREGVKETPKKEAPRKEAPPKIEAPKLSAKEKLEARKKENLDFLLGTTNEDLVVERLTNMNRSELIAAYKDEKLNPAGGGHDPKWSDDDLRQNVLNLWRHKQRNARMREDAQRRRDALAKRHARFAEYQTKIKDADAQHQKDVLQGRTGNPLVVTGTTYGNWTAKVPEDTGPLGIPVKNLTIDADSDGGYHIASGRLIQRNGVSYLIEDDDAKELMADEMADFLEATHKDLPGAQGIMRGYAWMKGSSPNDAYWQDRFKNPDHQAAASSGDGIMRFWGPGNAEGLDAQRQRAKHEWGHNVDNLIAGRDSSGSNSERWHRRADRDKDIPFPVGWQWDGVRKEPDKSKGEPHREVPWGVTDYGKSSWAEDYAESLDMFLRGPIGSAQQGIGKRVPVYFRDLFPYRAEMMDELFPDIGRRQKEEIARRGKLTFL